MKNLVFFQHGFVTGRSTTTQLVQCVETLSKTFDTCSQIDVIYMDLAKAFDSVPHSMILSKLSKYGIGGNIFKWLTSYLSNRHQHVIISGKALKWRKVNSGVPLGSILGPLLFLLYIDDICQVIRTISCCLLIMPISWNAHPVMIQRITLIINSTNCSITDISCEVNI